MKEFVRTSEYKRKIILAALDGHVIKDAELSCVYDKSKPRIWCQRTRTWIQFPRDLRQLGKKYVADLVLMKRTGQQEFYRAYKTSIRDMEGNVLG